MININIKSIASTIVLACISFQSFAMPIEEEAVTDFFSKLALYLIMGGGIAVILAAFGLLTRLLYIMIKARERQLYEQRGLAVPAEAKLVKKLSLWQRLNQRFTDAVPVERESDILFDHEYDGIRELDNNLPPWWLWLFYVTTVFAFFYIGYYHFSDYGISSEEAYILEVEEAHQQIALYLSLQADLVNESNVEPLVDEQALAEGKAIFVNNCATCHLESGGGSPNSVGPNLTDAYWIHGGGIKNVFKTIKYGVPEKGMIAWKAQLRPADLHKVASYILSLEGSNPSNAKGPEGEMYTKGVSM